jgi:hypothetical protein
MKLAPCLAVLSVAAFSSAIADEHQSAAAQPATPSVDHTARIDIMLAVERFRQAFATGNLEGIKRVLLRRFVEVPRWSAARGKDRRTDASHRDFSELQLPCGRDER